MATNSNGNLLDSAGNIVVDFVWGNFPLQPNDQRPDTATGRLNYDLDNHVLAETGWNGYPLFVPNTDGSAVDSDSPADGIQNDEIFLNIALNPNVTGTVELVIGQTTAQAIDTLKDEGFATANVLTGTAATNAKKDITRFNATSATVAVVYTSTASTAYPVGTKVVIAAGTPAGSSPVNLPAYAAGTWTVTAATSTTITIAGSGFTVADTTGVNATGTINGLADTIKSIAYTTGTRANQTGTTNVTVTPFAAAS
jgi:hypothetical protein